MKEVVGVVPTLHLREALQGRGRVGAADTLLALLADEPDVGRGRDSTGERLGQAGGPGLMLRALLDALDPWRRCSP